MWLGNGKEMAEAKAKTLEYFVTQFSKMLEENLDEYIENFESYIQVSQSKE